MKKLLMTGLLGVSLLAWGGYLSGQLKCMVYNTWDPTAKEYKLPVWGAIATGWSDKLISGEIIIKDCYENSGK